MPDRPYDDEEHLTFDTRPGAPRRPRRTPTPSVDQTQRMPVRRGQGSPSRPQSRSGRPIDQTQAMPRGQRAGGGRPRRESSYDDDPLLAAPAARPMRERPAGPRPAGPRQSGPRPPAGGPTAPPPVAAPRRKRRTFLKIGIVLALIVALWIGALVWAGLSAWGKVAKVDAFPSGDRAAAGAGTNVLLVGSDSRAGLSSQQAHALGTGGSAVTGGTSHTDSIMILHMGSGEPVLLSIPRDSYVQIPGHRKNKINASFAMGGPQLLIQTIEGATGIHIDDYMEIGFGGFAGVVDAVGGVRMCLPEAVKDSYAHIDLKAGCQTLNGPNALGYVRSRHAFAEGDLARVKHQRQFLAALMAKVSSPSNLLVPWHLKGIGESGAQGLAVNKGMSPYTALKIAWTLKNVTKSGQSIQVPVANAALYTWAGEAVEWDTVKADALFNAIKQDKSPNVTP